MKICIQFRMCLSICAQPLPSHFRGKATGRRALLGRSALWDALLAKNGVQGWGTNLSCARFTRNGARVTLTPPLPHSLKWDYSLYTSEIIGLKGQQQPAQGNALGIILWPMYALQGQKN